MGAVRYETMIEIDETDELTKFALSSGLWEIADGLYFLFEWVNSCTIHPMSEKLEALHSKFAFLWVYDDSMAIQALQDCTEMMVVLVWAPTCNEDVINVPVTCDP